MLPSLGLLAIDLAQAAQLPAVSIAAPGGLATFTAPLPPVPSLAGLPLFSQAVVVQAGSVRLSNAIADRIE